MSIASVLTKLRFEAFASGRIGAWPIIEPAAGCGVVTAFEMCPIAARQLKPALDLL